MLENLAPGQHAISAAIPIGWDLTGITCDDDDSLEDLANATAVLEIAPGEQVNCTFTLTQRGEATVVLNMVPDAPVAVAFSGGLGSFALTDDAASPGPASRTFQARPAYYPVSASIPRGWKLTELACSAPGLVLDLPRATAGMDLAPGGSLACTWTITKDGYFPAIKVNPTGGLVTAEAGASDTFTVVLNSAPKEVVRINLLSSDATEGMVDNSSLTFTAANWSVAQKVTVNGVDDPADDGDIAFTIVTEPAVSDDPDYQGMDPENVAVTNTDDDEAKPHVVNLSLSVTPLQEADAARKANGGAKAADAIITAILDIPASGEVNMTYGFTGEATLGDDFIISDDSVTFSSGETVAQTQISAVNDDLVEGDEIFTVFIESVNGAVLPTPPPEASGMILDADAVNAVFLVPALRPLGLLLLPLVIPIVAWWWMRRRSV